MLCAPVVLGRSSLAISQRAHPESSSDLETVWVDTAFLVIIPDGEAEGGLAIKKKTKLNKKLGVQRG